MTLPAYTSLDVTPDAFHAAMHAALGHQCTPSARGFGIIFAPDHRLDGRADLSGMANVALRQLQHAGLDPEAVTEADLAAWRTWFAETEQRHRVSTARFVVSGYVNEPYRGSEGSCGVFNYVRLMAGGESIAVDRVECLEEYDPEATNLMNRKGAVRHFPDRDKLGRALERMRKLHPEFAEAPVTDNSGA